MKVKINKIVCGNQGSREEEAADSLIANLYNFFKNSSVEGDINVIVNTMIYKYIRNEIDIILVGSLKNFTLNMHSCYKTKSCVDPFAAKDIQVEIRDFCFILEHKQQTFDEFANGMHGVNIDSLKGVTVYYPSTGDVENASTQAKTQADGLHKKLENDFGSSPYIVPMIWLENVPQKPANITDDVPNVLYGKFSIKELFEAACSYNKGYMPELIKSDIYILENKRGTQVNPISELLKKGSEKPKIIGNITRKRLEMITNDVLEIKLKDLHYDKGLLVWEGRAGTGKTSALLRIAHLLKEERNARCMILTYNRALVGDMRRTFAFLGVSYRPDGETIDVSTMQKFFIEIMDVCGIAKPKFGKNYIKQYNEGLKSLKEHIDASLLDATEIANIKKDTFHLSWDYVLVDEGQDWSDKEKYILTKFFADGHLVVADGVDQIVIPGGKHQNWLLGKTKDEYEKKKYEVGMRQLSVLTDFNIELAKIRGSEWSVKHNTMREAKGGRVVLFSTELFMEQSTRQLRSFYNNCVSAGNEAYDLMMLVPHQYTQEDKYGNKVLNEELRSNIDSAGIKLYDGTNDREREDYPLEEMRVFQYESCRGLEAWTTICLDLDVFLENKKTQYKDCPNPNVANTFEDRLGEYLNGWLMMPVTRSIHTLVITLNDIHSELSNQLRKVALKYELECYI